MKSLLLALLATSSLLAGEKVTLSLADFTDGNGGAPGAGWKTEEGGVMHLAPQKGTSFLISKKDYSSFEMEWDWKLDAAGNNGNGAVRGCREAVADYRAQHKIAGEILDIDWTGKYWRKE